MPKFAYLRKRRLVRWSISQSLLSKRPTKERLPENHTALDYLPHKQISIRLQVSKTDNSNPGV
jgi:hypothetical protein